jgi:hypothetical protein
MFKGSTVSRRALAAAPLFALLIALAPAALAQDAPAAPQNPTQTQQATPPSPTASTPATQTGTTTQAPAAQVASAPVGEAVANAPAEPLYREYKGVSLGMSAADVRAKLGKPQEKSDEMDFFVFSDNERARVYYKDGKASAVIATYLGNAAAPKPAAVLGTEIEARSDGSMYKMTPYPQAGYWVAYSRTAGDQPMVIITMQKSY